MANKGFNPVQGEKNVRVKAVDLLDRCMEMLTQFTPASPLAYDVNIFKASANKRKSKKGDDWEPTDQDLYDK
tara:strand:- start:643 stop:858 length:216 start_codon:yes stop_codon:yes gene_type:complete